MKNLCVITLSAAVLMAAACNNTGAPDQNRHNTDPMNASAADSGDIGLKPDEIEFMTEATKGGLTEIALSELVQQKSDNKRIQDFATMIIQDHSSANSQLSTLAGTKSVSLPDTLSRVNEMKAGKLAGEKGMDFERDYLETMIQDHKKAIADFDEAQKKAENPRLRAWIGNTLPDLQKHLDSATVIEDALGKRK